MRKKKSTLEDVIRLMIKEGGYKKTYKRGDGKKIKEADGNQTGVNLDPDEEEANSKAPNLKTSNQTPISAIGEGDDPVDPMDSRYDDDPIDVSDLEDSKHDISDPIDLDDDRLKDREHAYWVQDPKMWEAFKEYLTNGGLRRSEVTVDTFKLLSKARAKLDAGESIEFIGKEGTPEHDINMNFQDAIEDHDPAYWLKKSKESKMNESKKLTRSMLKTILQEEYQKVLEEYGMKPQYGRDDGAELVVADDYSGPLKQISNAVQEMIKDAYQIDDADIFDVTLEEPPDDDNYMIRVQWDAESIESVSEGDSPDYRQESEMDGATTLIQKANEGTLMLVSDFVNGIEDTTTLADMANVAKFLIDLEGMQAPTLTAGQLGKLINQYFGS